MCAEWGAAMTPDEDFKAVFESTTRKLAAQTPASRVRHLTPVPSTYGDAPEHSNISPLDAPFRHQDLETWWLPEPVGRWVEAQHASLGVPRTMAIAAALCAAATLVQGKVRVEIKPGWQEPLCLFWLVFSPTGSRKSALLKAATAPIRQLQREMEDRLRPDITAAQNRKARLEVQATRIRRTVKAHSYSEGHQEVMNQLRELEHELEELVVPAVPHWLYDDINPTVVPRKLRHNQEAEGIARLAVLDAEGTFLANLLGRHSGNVNVDPLLKGYGGEPIDMVRTVQGREETADTHLDAAHLTLLLLVQPHLLDSINEHPQLGSNGLLGRCLMSHLEADDKPMPWDAPPVPQDVQDGYASWLAALSDIPPETVWQVPASCLPTLKVMHEKLEADRLEGKGATGWTVRTLGRLCRILCLTELLSDASDCQTGGYGIRPVGPRAPHEGIGKEKILYLFSSIYYAGLQAAQAVEPVTHPTRSLAPRILALTLRQSDSSPIGRIVTLRQVQRGLTVSKDDALRGCEELVASGHFEQDAKSERRNRNGTITVNYVVVSTDPEAKPAPRLEIVPDDQGPPPDWMDQ